MTSTQKIIIVVDDNEANLTACKKILKPYYTVYPASSAAIMFDLLEHIKPDLILLDIEMPEINGYDAARMLKNSEASKGIPIIFLTGRTDAISEMEGLNLGALDYIRKPFVSALLLRRLEMHLSLIDYQEKLKNRNRSIEESLSRANLEICGLLNTIVDITGYAMDTDDPGAVKDCLNRVNAMSRELLAYVNDTLDITKI